jgi:hypothetical protein
MTRNVRPAFLAQFDIHPELRILAGFSYFIIIFARTKPGFHYLSRIGKRKSLHWSDWQSESHLIDWSKLVWNTKLNLVNQSECDAVIILPRRNQH